mmetsp:Transcript_16326/g.37778  ORF Transcript_16326/g.37778 Transcript_16326/m.37778 type:complete len:737 (+) Transcript_16326:191-2401(+)|eukprot:CAMPEP_0197174490 /NCGR_PEP_ID=MMETSP1423-20130617/989_1 /TAXON_ID=476441 /ORGANISM="Pseudo-nitzschia heimii, Strain UNC1101" /LENGTH=736 /DNA_ID=CAMNT_0042623431 /DNA_START=113 /DNA_END=2323 /DNA_ORIENTATION=-
MRGTALTIISRRSCPLRMIRAATAAGMASSNEKLTCQHRRPTQFRFMSKSAGGSKKNKKQAMRRQKNHNTTTTTSTSAETLAHSQAERNNNYLSSSVSASPSSGFRIISDPGTTSNASFDDRSGLSKLKLRPSLHDYLEKYDLCENYDTNNSSNGKGALAWESSKMIVPPTATLNKTPTGTNPSGLLLRNSSSLATGEKNRNIITDQDDDGFVIDRDSMYDPSIHLPHAPKDWKGYEAATPLSDFLMQRIGVSGQPISTAEYMRHALTHPLYGYYTSKEKNQAENANNDDEWDDDEYNIDETKETTNAKEIGRSTIFGRGGDFVTAPELSSIFGHSLCVWFMTVWQQEPLGKPPNIQLVELGPGRGTLMADLLELAHSSKLIDFGQAIRNVHLVESSRELRHEQEETLKKAVGHLVRLEFVQNGSDIQDHEDGNANTENHDDKSFVNTIRIEWHDDFSSFQSKRDKSLPVMVIMQEFLDALPVHQFQKTDDGWRERMIDVVSADETNEAGEPVPATPSSTDSNSDGKQLIPRLRQVLAPNVTPAVELLMSSSHEQYDRFPEGTVVEICPDALFLIQDVAKMLDESQGAALIIDYGEEGTTDTLRAFSRHQQVPLTSRPGQVDVTADVDFFAIKNCLSVDGFKRNKDNSTEKRDDDEIVPKSIHAFGPVPQGEFLMKMGAGELTMNAIEKDETTEEQAQALADALKYLVMPEHMGQKFKVLALSRKRDGLFGPAGIE